MKTEEVHVGTQVRLVHRIAALGLAMATTAFIATSVVVVVTGSSQAFGVTLGRVAAAPFRILF